MIKELKYFIKGNIMQDSHVTIEVTGSARSDGTNAITTRTTGKLYTKGGKRYLLYELPDEDNRSVVVKHMIIFNNRNIEITKSAPGLKTRILYEPGASTETDYSTPYGNLTLVFSTKSITYDESDVRLLIEVNYDIFSGGELLSENRLVIDCTML